MSSSNGLRPGTRVYVAQTYWNRIRRGSLGTVRQPSSEDRMAGAGSTVLVAFDDLLPGGGVPDEDGVQRLWLDPRFLTVAEEEES